MKTTKFITDTAREVAPTLKPALRKGILSKPGSGDFSSATRDRLADLGLIDESYRPTLLGWAVRKALGARDE